MSVVKPESAAHITNKNQMGTDKNLQRYSGFGYMGETEIC